MPQEYREPTDGSDGAGDVDIGALAAGTAPAAGAEPGRVKRKYTRRNGSAPGAAPAKGQKVALDLSSITGLFVGLHVVIAQASKTPELAITMEEGGHIMTSAQNVMRHYNVQSTQKTLDWISLAGAVSMVYVPRVIAIAANKRARTIEQPRPQNSMAPASEVELGASVYDMNNVAHPEHDS